MTDKPEAPEEPDYKKIGLQLTKDVNRLLETCQTHGRRISALEVENAQLRVEIARLR
jgi:hypothetical protein